MELTSGGNRQDSGGSAQGGQANEQAKQQAPHVAQRTEQKAGEVPDQAGHRAKGQFSTQIERAVRALDRVAQALRQSRQHLQEQDWRLTPELGGLT